MKNLLKKYNEMEYNEKENLKQLNIIHELELQLSKYKDLELNMEDKSIIIETIMELITYSNIKDNEIISRLLEILQCRDIDIDDIIELDIQELIELIANEKDDFKEVEYKIITEFTYKSYYCVLVKRGNQYLLIYDKDNNSHVDIFKNFEEILCYVIKNKLLSEGISIA